MDQAIEIMVPPEQAFPATSSWFLRDLDRCPQPGSPSTRTLMARAAAIGIHGFWLDRYWLEDYPPMLWRFETTAQGWRLSRPASMSRLDESMTINQLIRCFARWRQELLGMIEDRWLTRFLIHFIRMEPIDPERVNLLFAEISSGARALRPALVQNALLRYQRIHPRNSRSPTVAEFLADRHIPLLTDEQPGERFLAQDWLREALRQGTDWYSATASWSRLLQRIEALGFDLAERPLLRQIWLVNPAQGNRFPAPCFPSSVFQPARKRWLDRPLDLAGELEEEIHRLRSTVPLS